MELLTSCRDFRNQKGGLFLKIFNFHIGVSVDTNTFNNFKKWGYPPKSWCRDLIISAKVLALEAIAASPQFHLNATRRKVMMCELRIKQTDSFVTNREHKWTTRSPFPSLSDGFRKWKWEIYHVSFLSHITGDKEEEFWVDLEMKRIIIVRYEIWKKDLCH